GAPQVLRGWVGLVVPDLDALIARLAEVKPKLAGTKFAYTVEDKHVAVTCPWGNRLRCFAAGPGFGDMTLGMPCVEFPVAPGRARAALRHRARGALLHAPDVPAPPREPEPRAAPADVPARARRVLPRGRLAAPHRPTTRSPAQSISSPVGVGVIPPDRDRPPIVCWLPVGGGGG